MIPLQTCVAREVSFRACRGEEEEYKRLRETASKFVLGTLTFVGTGGRMFVCAAGQWIRSDFFH